MHVVISLLLQSTQFWWYLTNFFDTASRRHNDVILLPAYAECLVTTLCSSRTVHRTPRRTRATVELLRQETPNFFALNLWPPNNPDFSPLDYEIWAVMQHGVYHKQIHELKRRLIDVWCGLEQSILTRLLTSGDWRGRHWACVHAKGGHFEYSL